jgi:hypothetical protein
LHKQGLHSAEYDIYVKKKKNLYTSLTKKEDPVYAILKRKYDRKGRARRNWNKSKLVYRKESYRKRRKRKRKEKERKKKEKNGPKIQESN